MKTNTEYGLEGAFKVDIFNGKGNLIDTTDYFSNFITYSGLIYPLTYHFPECFKFLTIGTASTANYTYTTGIAGNPISLDVIDLFNGFSFPDQILSYLGPANYQKASCGVQISKDGPAYFRAWRIPSGINTVAGQDVTFKEFMVSPSSGNDASGRVAFSRVAREVTLRSGSSAVVSYQLKLKVQSTGINYLTGFNTTKADLQDGELATLWSTGTTGHYRQVYHGLSVMDPNGNTFIPKFGDAMEPACRNFDNLTAYFSADNSQFDCNPTGGNALSFSKSYNADGLLNVAFDHDYSEDVLEANPQLYTFVKTDIKTDFPEDIKNYAKDIRYKTVKDPDYKNYTGASISKNYNNTFSITDVSVASPGNLGYNTELLDYRNKATLAAVIIPLRFNPNSGQQDRKKTITRRAIFTPVKSYGHNSRFGSFVYAFNESATAAGPFWPVVDCLFSNNSGQLLMDHFRAITGVHFESNGNGISTVSGRMVLKPESFGKFNYELLTDSNGLLTGFAQDEDYLSGLYDMSFAPHKLTDLNEPSTTGKLYYPTSVTENNLVSIKFNNLHFYRGGFGNIITGAYNFTPTTQLIADFKFSGLKFSGTSGEALTTYLTGSDTLAVADSNIASGFYITKDYITGSETDLNEADLVESLTGYTLSYFSGSIYSGNSFFTGVNVIINESSQFQYNTGEGADLETGVNRVTRFFDSGNFLSSIASRGSGIVLPNSAFKVVFSGKGTLGEDLYLTYLHNPDGNNTAFWRGTSEITGLIRYTDFSLPSVTYMHKETGMLKPNNYYLGYSGDLLSQIHGGTYPGLSDKNTLEVDINISWSAPCAGVVGACDDP